MTEITDPATEMHKLCLALKAYQHKGPTRDALAQVFGVEAESSAYFEMMGHLASRFSRLTALYEMTLDEPVRSLAVKTVRHLQSLLASQHQTAAWNTTKTNIFDDVRLNTLLMSAPHLRTKAPLTTPTAEERKNAAEQIDIAIAALQDHHGAVSAAFSSSLRTIKLMLERFDLYGVDGFTSEFFRAFAIRSAAEREVDVPEPERCARMSAWAAITMVAGLVIGSDAIATAIENHYSRSQAVIQLLITETKFLPSPTPENRPPESKASVPSETKRRSNRKTSR